MGDGAVLTALLHNRRERGYTTGRVEVRHILHVNSAEDRYRRRQWQDESQCCGQLTLNCGAINEAVVVHLRVDQGTVKSEPHHPMPTSRSNR
jgi:hypothetical protein